MTTTETIRQDPQVAAAVPDEVIDQVMAGVDSGGLQLLGPDGVLAELTKRLLDRAMDEELTDHLGYERGDAGGRGSGNNRNGTSAKTVLTEVGAVDLAIPRDRNGTFDPKIVPNTPGASRGSTPTSSTSTPGASRLVTSAGSWPACTASRCPRS